MYIINSSFRFLHTFAKMMSSIRSRWCNNYCPSLSKSREICLDGVIPRYTDTWAYGFTLILLYSLPTALAKAFITALVFPVLLCDLIYANRLFLNTSSQLPPEDWHVTTRNYSRHITVKWIWTVTICWIMSEHNSLL